MKTAAIYARYSSERQTEQSIEGQIRECTAFAKRNDILIVNTYIDRAMTGTNDNRTDFQRMLKDCTKRAWDIVLVYKLDRFSRNKYEMAMHKKTLRDNGIKLVPAMENIPDSPEGIIFESLLEGMAEYYSVETDLYYLNARYYDPYLKRFLNPDTLDNLGANGDLNSFNLYAYCSNNPVMYVDPTGEIAWLLVAIVALVVVDTIVETSILLNSEEYKAENVYNGEAVEIPNSAYFNNPIAQYIYADYLCENVENGEYFTGGVYDIVAEWQWHNTVFAGINLFVGPMIANEIPYTIQARDLNLKENLDAEYFGRYYEVFVPSFFFKKLNQIVTFGLFE